MADSEDFTKTRFWKDIYIWDVWNIWGGAWRQACPNKIQPPQTSSIFICHTSVNIRSYEGVCAQRTLFFVAWACTEMNIYPLITLCFIFLFASWSLVNFRLQSLIVPPLEQYKALLQDIGLLVISHVLDFLFFHSLYDHTWHQVRNNESVTVLWYQNKLIKVI